MNCFYFLALAIVFYLSIRVCDKKTMDARVKREEFNAHPTSNT